MEKNGKNRQKRRLQNLFYGLFFFGFVLVSLPLFAQYHCFTLIKSTPDKILIRFQSDSLFFHKIKTSRGIAQIPFSVGDGYPVLKKGAPTVLRYAVPVQIPRGDSMQVKVLSARFSVVKNILLSPSGGETTRIYPADSVAVFFGDEYRHNAFYPVACWKTGQPYVIRREAGQTLSVFPLMYNPVKKMLRIYREIIFEITFHTKNGEKASPLSLLPLEATIFPSPHFINRLNGSFKAQRKTDGYPVMLIISDRRFISELKDFIRWKRQEGFDVIVADVSRFDNAVSIKNYIGSLYRKKNLAYVLLVGDAQQVPAGYLAGGASDMYYSYVDGNDHYPDLLVGRLSAETTDQLRIMLRRTLAYEKALSGDVHGYAKAIGIASDDGPGYLQLTDARHIRIIDSTLLRPAGYTTITELFDGEKSGKDVSGNPDAEQLIRAVEDGAGLINYCGHGSVLGWTTTHFGNQQVGELTNTRDWPVIFSVSCATGDFVHHECFAEKWLRASIKGNPTGAVALFMPSTAQSWAPPMCAQREINRLLTLPDSVNVPRTFAALCAGGCLKMNEQFGTEGYKMTDTWVVFGDPSLTVRTKAPEKIEAMYSALCCDTCRQIRITTTVPYGRVTVVAGDSLYASALTDPSGKVVLTLPVIPPEKTARITITAFNHRPFTGNITWSATSERNGTSDNEVQFSCYPNPAREKTALSFVLKKEETVTLSAVAINGKSEEILFQGVLPAGLHRFQWQPETKGVYFVEIKTKNRVFGEKVIFLK